MLENTIIKEFMETELKQATSEFWQSTQQEVANQIPRFVPEIKKTFEELFFDVRKVQEERDTGIGKITVSLLRVSAFEEKKRAKIEVYDKDEITGKLLLEKELDISTLFIKWEDYRLRLLELAEKKGVRGMIKEPVLRYMMGQKLTDMASYLYATLKYILMDADEMEHFGLIKKEPGFAITVGEYQDWQRVVYMEMPPFDLANPPKEHPMVCGRFEGQTYKGLQLTKQNLERAKFVRCKFVRCVFEEVNLNDVRFIDCIFQDVQMRSGTMYGALLLGCEMLNSDFSGMKTEWIPFLNTKEEYEIYQNFLWIREAEKEDGEQKTKERD